MMKKRRSGEMLFRRVRMKHMVALMMLVLLGMAFSAEASDSLRTARQLFEKAEYRQGLQTLLRSLRDKSTPADKRPDIMLMLADFYAKDVGNYQHAEAYLRKIISSPDSDRHPARAAAEQRLKELQHLARKDADISDVINEARINPIRNEKDPDEFEKENLLSHIDNLSAVVSRRPGYYKRYEVHYLLGLMYLKLDCPWSALRQFRSAASLKPALFLYLPIQRLKQSARASWLRDAGRTAALTVCAALIVSLVIGFGLSRPWRWLRYRHLFIGILLSLVWGGLFWAAAEWIGEAGDPKALINSDHFFPQPTYVETRWGSPGSEISGVLFIYGTAALAGIYFFSLFISRLKKRYLVFGFNTVFAALAMASALTLFYLQHCDLKSRYYVKEGAALSWLQGYLAFGINEPEPYLLTDPTAYPEIKMYSIDDPNLVLWLKRYR